MSRNTISLGSGYSFLEGPRWHRGEIYVSDFYTHRVLAFNPDGARRTVCTVPGQPSGLGFLPNGVMLVVSMRDRRLLRLEGSRLIEVADLSGLAPFWCNDMLVDRLGRAYVGNFGWNVLEDTNIRTTNVIMVLPDGSARPVADGLTFPNGIVITPDGGTMLIAETFAARISAFDVAADGSLHNRRPWAVFSDSGFASIAEAVASACPLPDGMALDAEGKVWCGDAAARGALRIGEGGAIVDRIDTGELSAYAVALGGSDRRTLYMCCSPPLLTNDPATDHRSSLLACRVDIAGNGFP
jgi:sugar lactone lactonase YvrE